MDRAGFAARPPKWRLIKNMSREATRGEKGERSEGDTLRTSYCYLGEILIVRMGFVKLIVGIDY